MKKFRLGSKITKEIEQMAKEVVNTDCQSFDHNRALFQKRLKDYYKEGLHSSDNLIMRKNEIDYYGNRLTDVLSSALASTILGFVVSFIGEYVFPDTPNIMLDLIFKLFVFTFIAVCSFTFMCHTIRGLSGLTNYQKLHCEDFEKKLIDSELEARLKAITEAHTEEPCAQTTETADSTSEQDNILLV